ncbi:hypothetical protein FKP32DRAFT_1641248, partial [Trametes sanguinea]
MEADMTYPASSSRGTTHSVADVALSGGVTRVPGTPSHLPPRNTVPPSFTQSAVNSVSVNSVYVVQEGGQTRMIPRAITQNHLDTLFQFKTVCDSYAVTAQPQAGDLMFRAPLQQVLTCSRSIDYVFHTLRSPRAASRQQPEPAEPVDVELPSNGDTESYECLTVPDAELKHAIIAEWEQAMSTSASLEIVCAACGRDTPPSRILTVNAHKIDFSLLRNDELPEHVLPTSYARSAYHGAILHPRGLTTLDVLGDVRLCKECSVQLYQGRMPKFALANWLYYGHERLPGDVRAAFNVSTHVERMLVSRARASRISYKFSQLPGHYLEGTDPRISQSCVKGNIAVHPQDATHLNSVLPPANDIIRDSICAVFVGETKPTRETIEKLKPVLVRKSRVKRMIEFLTANNPWYAPSHQFAGMSQQNLDTLFGPGTAHLDQGVPCAMEIGHIPLSDAVKAATDDYVPGRDDELRPKDDDMLMETVGYIDSDDSPVDYSTMSLRALKHCLNGGTFLKSQAGSQLIPDFENPQLLSWLFPHLDPWGIGGFYDSRRRVKLSLDQQLKYLLMVNGSPFRCDPDFAFVYYNIRQKRAVFDSITFRVAASEREFVIHQLLSVDVKRVDKLIAEFKVNPHYQPSAPEDIAIVRLLMKVNTVAHDLPGSNGYKVMLRNQIRALVNFEGPPTLFVTLNPSDRDHPLVRLYAGHEISIEDEMRGEELSRWQRSVIAAQNPSACARFFNKMISQFIHVILRYRRADRGLFG